MAGPRLVRGQRPGSGIVGEVVIFIGRVFRAGSSGLVHRQHELPLLTGIADEPRRRHVRRRLHGAFRVGRQPDARRPRRQCHQPLLAHNILNAVQRIFIARQNVAARDLLLLQFADHIAIIRDGESFLLRH